MPLFLTLFPKSSFNHSGCWLHAPTSPLTPQVTAGVRPQFGSVYRLYEASTGRRIHKMSELQEGVAYVAAGQGARNFSVSLESRKKAYALGSLSSSTHQRAVSALLERFKPLPYEGIVETPPSKPDHQPGVLPATKRVVRSGRAQKLVDAAKPVIIKWVAGNTTL